jgi:hypothetical protein
MGATATTLLGGKAKAHALATIGDVALKDTAQLLSKIFVGVGMLLDGAADRSMTLVILRLEPIVFGL